MSAVPAPDPSSVAGYLPIPAPRLAPGEGATVLRHLPPVRAAVPEDRITPPPHPDGATVRVSDSEIIVAGADPRGERYARTLVAHLAATGRLRAGEYQDWPSLGIRGVIEGFYGEPWSHAERLQLIEELGRWRMNRYVYAPKDDPYHRRLWREHYPSQSAAPIAELAAAGWRAGVQVVYALHPGLDMVHSSEADHRALAAKARGLHALGIERFALLFDDIDQELHDPADVARWGPGPGGAGRSHGETCARFDVEVLAPLGLGGTLLMVPTDYAGSGSSPYRAGLDETLGSSTSVFWTGDDIVVGAVTAADTQGAAEAFGGRELVLWDNFPVNDFDRSRAFLGPLTGRESGLPAAGLAGIVANPMVEYQPSRFALHTVAAWAWNPEAYDADAAASRALTAVAGQEAPVLAALVAAASSWPPSAPEHPALERLVEEAFDDEGRIGAELRSTLDDLLRLGRPREATVLGAALSPWATAAARTVRVIESALAHARGEGTAGEVLAAWEEARTAGHGVAGDVARAAAERALGHPVAERVRREGVPAATDALGG